MVSCCCANIHVYRRNSKLFKIIPVKGSGDFMIDMKDVKVSLTVVLRNNQEMLDIENFNGGHRTLAKFMFVERNILFSGRRVAGHRVQV